MSSPFTTYPAPERTFIPSGPGVSGSSAARGTGAKRGRKPKAAGNLSAANSPRPTPTSPLPGGSSQSAELQWQNVPATTLSDAGAFVAGSSTDATAEQRVQDAPGLASGTGGVISLPGASAGSNSAAADPTLPRPAGAPGEEDGEGEDEMLPAMADDDYSAQAYYQSQSKDNLKVLMDNFSPAQYDRFEAYRRHALPKQAVRKVIQQTLGQQVSQPVAQIVAGFAKVFVGEVVEKARAVQERRGERGPLSPDHLREAYRMYQQETGRVGAARPLRGKRLFVR